MQSEFQFIPFVAACQHDPQRLVFFRQAPAVVQLFPPGNGKPALYLALGLEEIDAALKHPEFGMPSKDGMSSDEQRLVQVHAWPLLELLNKTMPFVLSGEEHTRAHDLFNKIMQEALRAPWRRRVAGQVAEEVSRLKLACLATGGFDDGVFDGQAIDLAWYLNLVCTRLILMLVGIPEELAATIIGWTGAFAVVADRSASTEALERANEAAGAFWDMLIPLLGTPPLREGICQSLFRMQEDGELTRDQLIATVLTFIAVAAENPPRAALSLVRGLSAYPDQLQLLRERCSQEDSSRELPGIMLLAVDEAICWDTSVGYIMRSALVPCSLGGLELLPGDEIACIPEAIHTNETLRPQPERFLIERPNRVIRSFGGGAWACTGRWLARYIVGCIGKSLLVDERPRIEFTGRQAVFGDNSFFRGPAHFYVTCSFESDNGH